MFLIPQHLSYSVYSQSEVKGLLKQHTSGSELHAGAQQAEHAQLQGLSGCSSSAVACQARSAAGLLPPSAPLLPQPPLRPSVRSKTATPAAGGRGCLPPRVPPRDPSQAEATIWAP